MDTARRIAAAAAEPLAFRQGAVAGALVGVFEALAVLRWNYSGEPWWMDALWGAGLVAVDALGLAVLSLALGRLTPRAASLALLGCAALVIAARVLVGDRFQWASLGALPVVVLGAWRGQGPGLGLGAAALGLLALWGRVPNYSVPWLEQALFYAPGVVLCAGLGALQRRARLQLALGAAALIASALWHHGHGGAARADAARPNLLFVLVDTLRTDTLDAWGGSHAPFTRVLAEQGLRFDQALTVVPKTTQSVASMQTGRYPVSHGLRSLHGRLAEANRTLAEVLGQHGYQSAAFVHNAWVQRGRGLEQGFDEFWSWYELHAPYGPLRYSSVVTLLDGLSLRRTSGFDGNTDARVTTDRAIEWLERVDGPFYGYVHYFDPHWPYRPPGQDGECLVNNIQDSEVRRGEMIFHNRLPEAENARARELYAGEVRYNLDQIGRLIDYLDRSGRGDNTVVVFTADHGHHLGDHEYYYHHGEFLYEPGVRIPLILRYPPKITPGSVEPRMVRSIDLMPTLLSLLGVPAPKLDGVDVLEQPPQHAFLETDVSHFRENTRRYVPGVLGNVRAVRTDQYKLVYTPRKGPGVWELYDVRADPDELHNLIGSARVPQEVTRDLLAKLASHLVPAERAELEKLGNRFDALVQGASPAGGGGGAAQDTKSATDVELLRSLGYVQ